MDERIPEAKNLELRGIDHPPYLSDCNATIGATEEFLTGMRHYYVDDRLIATLMFTDIVGATEAAARMGDRRWREVLARHHDAVRHELRQFRGREIDTTGDAFFAAFDGPARAVRCACAIGEALRPLGLEMRAGVHTGECELMGDKVGVIAVHVGARIAARAAAGEVIVSRMVKDLVSG
ncbi:adenylate/guanylate cyclase domain-containing protein [Variovorax saccharolyticus]|uniref:adenylate/guanylate cyclase domain-containing protein n=1 Tax=Variovorax saccharolyticus TaxID=3053516 RepID=UPI0025791D03|nr:MULTISPECIES: adenylate/guanylate cyclase domain-containing protein [unclassified Variovorax]MDM0022384.1 adenylate/guanylate cyclase domain-containing protein [Variovorax sp. J22R187]MDM0029040.1 adenylate/guanylate cyclase domain-containing protein [Variovorax sp. J31P216]